MPIIEREIRSGEPWHVGGYEITPINQVLKIMLPGNSAGLIWNRPRAVVAKSEDGQEQVLPVTDVTRVAIWAMLVGGLFGTILMGRMYRHK